MVRSLLLVPDGVSLRNFVLGDTVDRLAGAGEVVVLAAPSLAPPRSGPDAPWSAWLALPPFGDRPTEAIVRRTLEYAHLRWLDTTGSRFNLAQPIPGGPRGRALRTVARSASRAFASERGVATLASVHTRLAGRRPEVEAAAKLLADLRPDVVFCAHQRQPSVLPMILAAQAAGIPTATFIFSWDNLTTKARVVAPFDHYLVWSDLMATELRRFYPDVTAERVHVVGSPQFDPYAQAGLTTSRRDLCAELGLDPDRPVVCFTGGDSGTCPDDPFHLAQLLAVAASGAVAGSPQVVLRRAPVDRGDRYDAVRQAHPELVEAAPRWRHEPGAGWGEAYPTLDDVRVLTSLTAAVDVNVNMASTMSIDFALRDTAVVNLGWDEDPAAGRADAYYTFEHYRPVVELGAVRVAHDPDELAAHLSAYLADPSLDAAERRALCELELGVPVGESSAAVAAALVAIAGR
jgi:hypothetical protein